MHLKIVGKVLSSQTIVGYNGKRGVIQLWRKFDGARLTEIRGINKCFCRLDYQSARK